MQRRIFTSCHAYRDTFCSVCIASSTSDPYTSLMDICVLHAAHAPWLPENGSQIWAASKRLHNRNQLKSQRGGIVRYASHSARNVRHACIMLLASRCIRPPCHHSKWHSTCTHCVRACGTCIHCELLTLHFHDSWKGFCNFRC